jgi:hypothetical protein
MAFTEQEIRMLSEASAERNWASIPDGCPAKFVQKICETRARLIGYRSAASPQVAPKPQQLSDVNVDELRERLLAVSL